MKLTYNFYTKRKCRLSQLKKNEVFMFEGKKKVYVYGGGGKVRGFNYSAFDDISAHYTTKTDRQVIASPDI